MKSLRNVLLILAFVASCGVMRAQLVTYSFGSAASPTTSATSFDSLVTVSVFSGSLGTPTTGSGTPVYSAGSGGSFFTATAWTGTAPGTNYFQFTVTPTAGYEFSATSISFGYRATSTGPTSLAIRSSADSYSTSLATATLTNDSTWYASGNLSITLSGLNSATTFRIYGSGASSAAGTFRVDDVVLNGAVTSAVPEPSTYAAIFGALALVVIVVQRRRHSRPA